MTALTERVIRHIPDILAAAVLVYACVLLLLCLTGVVNLL